MNAIVIKEQLEAAGHTVKHCPPTNPGADHDDLKVWMVDDNEPISKKELILFATGQNLVPPPAASMTQDLPESFVIEGFRYYSQGRKCGKPGCCCKEGKLHGPYWYRRDTQTGARKYIGKQLPENIVLVYLALEGRRSRINAEIRNTQLQLRCLEKLMRNEPLTTSEKVFLKHSGYKDCLV